MKLQQFLLILFMGIALSCKKSKNHPVPSIPFDISININLPSYSELNNVSGWVYVNGGSRGIIVYRRGIDDFVAFDRHSPADPEGTCPQPLTPDQNNFLNLLDTCGSAVFSLYDGSPVSNSDVGLRMYQTSWNGTETVRIFNN